MSDGRASGCSLQVLRKSAPAMKSADALLRDVHDRLGLGIDVQTFPAIEVRWRRDYDGEWSDERFFTAGSLVGALQAILDYEDSADRDERSALDEQLGE